MHNHGIVEEVRKALNAEIGGTTAVSYYPSHSVPSLCRQLLLSLQQAIYKMSGMPAAKLGLTDRGILAEGKKADILVIDLEKLRQRHLQGGQGSLRRHRMRDGQRPNRR